MPIKPEHLRNFYFGAGAESFISSQLQMFNCQVGKLSPDFGFDLHVTNLAAANYLEAQQVDYYIQIKAQIYYSSRNESKYRYIISEQDIELIKSTPNAIVIFAIAKPRILGDPCSFDENYARYMMLDEQIETSGIEYFFNQSPQKARECVGYSEVAEKIKGYDLSYIWCNRNHILSMLNKAAIKKTDKYIFEFSISEDCEFSFDGHKLVPEMHNLWYLINRCLGTNQLEEGHMFHWSDILD